MDGWRGLLLLLLSSGLMERKTMRSTTMRKKLNRASLTPRFALILPLSAVRRHTSEWACSYSQPTLPTSSGFCLLLLHCISMELCRLPLRQLYTQRSVQAGHTGQHCCQAHLRRLILSFHQRAVNTAGSIMHAIALYSFAPCSVKTVFTGMLPQLLFCNIH